jgi:hypothetical protein
MGFIAIVGGGALGGAVAHRLATRDRVGEVRLIDAAEAVVRGKALDILQSAPIDGFSTRMTSAETVEAAVGAAVVIVADSASGDREHAGEPGLMPLRQLVRTLYGAHFARRRDAKGSDRESCQRNFTFRPRASWVPRPLRSSRRFARWPGLRSTAPRSKSVCGSSVFLPARLSSPGRKRRHLVSR